MLLFYPDIRSVHSWNLPFLQESRKLKADAANANLELEKTRKERDVLKKSVEVLEAVGKDTSSNLEKLKEENERLCLSKQELVAARDAIDTKDSEIEDKTTEIEALKDQVQTLETILKTSGRNRHVGGL